jgi:hypothetical protein
MTNYEKAAEDWIKKVWAEDCETNNLLAPILTVKDAFLAGCEHARPKWISVKDRLPDVGWYLVYHLREMDIDLLIKNTSGGSRWVYYNETITHWMSLPDKPEGEE